MLNHTRFLALLLSLVTVQAGCYSSYFISKDELRKLESSVEQKDIVRVYGDCPVDSVAASHTASAHTTQGNRYGVLYAEASTPQDADAVVSDASDAVVEADEAVPPGCTPVDVSTANPLVIQTQEGSDLRVTPFNFIMSGRQIVSPEYDMLENLSDVKGAEVSEFSTWKTVLLVVGIAGAAVGAFVGVSLLGGSSSGFSN